ncbi:MAG: hypothetical protein LBD67_00465 [Candidatus Accumulibacter sp.]|nr:hypothetical protein [Accumulibacter sp.]
MSVPILSLRQRLSPFVLSLSKYERTLLPSQSLPFDKLRANGLERRSSTRFLRQAQDRQGERIEKKVSGNPKRLKTV